MENFDPTTLGLVALIVVVASMTGYFFARVRFASAQREIDLELAQTKANYEHAQSAIEGLNERIDGLTTELQDTRNDLGMAREHSKSFEVKAEQSDKQQRGVKQELEALEVKLDASRRALSEKDAKLNSLSTSLEEREVSYKREIESFDKQKEELKLQFQQLSNEILERNAKILQEANKQSISSTINPFKESMDAFKKQLSDNHQHETVQRTELRKELESLKELNLKITTEAHELSTALRGQKKLQGNWGELVLENVLERSGLQLGEDYKREVSFTTEEGRQRPDAVVYLPQNKHLIIDAKVSLNAYTRFVNSEDEAERTLALGEHVSAMRDRIKELADRDYYKLEGLNSPEIVFMFVPIESAFVEALKADELLFQEAIAKNVLVATPTTLLTSLNIVRQLWRYEDQNKHTVELAKKAEGVFKKLNSFLASFEGVKKGLDKAQEAYVKAEGQLVSGKGNLVKQVSEFKKLAPAIKAELPEYFSEKAELEIDLVSKDEPEVLAEIEPDVRAKTNRKTAKEVDHQPDLIDAATVLESSVGEADK